MSVDAPTLDDVLDAASRAALAGLNFCTVGTVQSYDGAKREAVVLPSISRRGLNGEFITPEPIANVPVSFLGTLFAGIQFDIPKGTSGLLVFTDAGIGDWLASPAIPPIVEPTSTGTHTLYDAIFYPGVVPFAVARATEANMLEVYNGLGRVKIDVTGRMKIGTELVDLLVLFDQLLDALTAGVTIGTAATQKFDPATVALFAKVKAQLATIKL